MRERRAEAPVVRIHIESTIPSCVGARPASDPIQAARQELAREKPWIKKQERPYGYKTHVKCHATRKLIEHYNLTDASVQESRSPVE